jgi:hypothetical protein
MVPWLPCDGLDGDALSSEEKSVNGPGAWSEHCQAYAEYGKQQVALVPGWICDRHQQLSGPLDSGHERGPEPETDADPYKNQSDVDFPERRVWQGQHHLDSLHDQRTTRGKAK